MSKYKQRFVQLLEGSDNFSLHMYFQIKYQTCCNCVLYGAWSSCLPVPHVGTELSFYGNNFMIDKSKINDVSLGLFILSHVLVPHK